LREGVCDAVNALSYDKNGWQIDPLLQYFGCQNIIYNGKIHNIILGENGWISGCIIERDNIQLIKNKRRPLIRSMKRKREREQGKA
jgi:hypothetical protein